MTTKKKLGLFDLTMIVVGLVIGMGIFRTPVVAAAKSGSAPIFFLAWVIGGIVALCGALTYAEIGSRYPVTGGYYKVFSFAYHPSFAFAVNCIILVSNAGSIAVVGVIGAEYIGKFFFDGPAPALFKQVVTICAVGLFYAVNMMGLKMSSRVQNLLMLFKITLILLLLLSVFGTHPMETWTAGQAANTASETAGTVSWLKALGTGLIAVSFCYGGYQQTINFGGDIREPARTIPRGIGYGIAIIILLYLSINAVYVKVIGFETLKHADGIAAILIGHLFGPVGETILRVLMFLSVLGYVNVTLMSNPRVMFAMSEEGILPPAFKVKTRQNEAIVYSLTAFCLAIIFTLLFSSAVEKIINYTIFLDSIGMSSSAATLFIMRKRGIGEDREGIFRMKLYPLLPIIFIISYIAIALSIIVDDPAAAGYGGLIFACFFGLYFIARLKKPGRRGV